MRCCERRATRQVVRLGRGGEDTERVAGRAEVFDIAPDLIVVRHRCAVPGAVDRDCVGAAGERAPYRHRQTLERQHPFGVGRRHILARERRTISLHGTTDAGDRSLRRLGAGVEVFLVAVVGVAAVGADIVGFTP